MEINVTHGDSSVSFVFGPNGAVFQSSSNGDWFIKSDQGDSATNLQSGMMIGAEHFTFLYTVAKKAILEVRV